MQLHRRPASAIAGGLFPDTRAVGTVAAPESASVPGRSASASAPGTAHAEARSVTVRAAAAHVRASVGSPAMLGHDATPAGTRLAPSAPDGFRPNPSGTGSQAARPSTIQLAAARPSARVGAAPAPRPAAPNAPAAVAIHGVTQGGTGCSNCPAPDVTAAINTTQIAEAVNLELRVYTRSGTSLCSVSLSRLLGAPGALSGPRIQYDTAKKRFSLVIDSAPSSSTDVAVQYPATGQADDARGTWWVYSIEFPASTTYPLGAPLHYAYPGQDGVSILTSRNNSFGHAYLDSAAYAMPKAIAHTGASLTITTYPVAFSTAPVTAAGVPIASTTTTSWVAAIPGSGYDVYSMPASPAWAITLKCLIRDPFSAPTRWIAQPGTSQALDPGDGRISSAAVRDGSTVRFAHDVDDGGFPTVLYGAISEPSGQISAAPAYLGGGSDDFNPSITVTPAGVATFDAVAGVAPGDGEPDLAGVDSALVSGSPTAPDSSFGRWSSASIDPTGTSSFPAGLTAHESFNSAGQWTTQLARTTFC